MLDDVRPSIDLVRDLTPEDLKNLVRTPGAANPMQRLRDSHHRVARLVATGLRLSEIAQATGYSYHRVWVLREDPSFQELVAHYRDVVNDSFKESIDEYYSTMAANRVLAARLINDKLSAAEPDDVGLRELVLIHSDAADRTGYPKRTVALNVNADFASLLDRAIERSKESKTIEHQPSGPSAEGGQESPLPSGPQPIRRLA